MASDQTGTRVTWFYPSFNPTSEDFISNEYSRYGTRQATSEGVRANASTATWLIIPILATFALITLTPNQQYLRYIIALALVGINYLASQGEISKLVEDKKLKSYALKQARLELKECLDGKRSWSELDELKHQRKEINKFGRTVKEEFTITALFGLFFIIMRLEIPSPNVEIWTIVWQVAIYIAWISSFIFLFLRLPESRTQKPFIVHGFSVLEDNGQYFLIPARACYDDLPDTQEQMDEMETIFFMYNGQKQLFYKVEVKETYPPIWSNYQYEKVTMI